VIFISLCNGHLIWYVICHTPNTLLPSHTFIYVVHSLKSAHYAMSCWCAVNSASFSRMYTRKSEGGLLNLLLELACHGSKGISNVATGYISVCHGNTHYALSLNQPMLSWQQHTLVIRQFKLPWKYTCCQNSSMMTKTRSSCVDHGLYIAQRSQAVMQRDITRFL